VLVVGGDGTLSEAVQGFFEDGTPIGTDACLMVMPAGRGDDFFKSMLGRRCLSSEDAWQQGLELLRNGSPLPADVGRISWLGSEGQELGAGTRYFVNIASFGYPGLVVQRVLSRAGVWGRSRAGKSAWAYLLQSAAGMLEYKPLGVEVRLDGQEFFEGPLFSGFVLNGSYNAGGVRWSDRARIDDGAFHVLAVPPRDLLSTLKSSPRMLSGDWSGVPGLRSGTARKVRVLAQGGPDRGFPLFEIDGDQPEPGNACGAELECLQGAIRIWR
jgi:diacylglycerol kinase family enzyme